MTRQLPSGKWVPVMDTILLLAAQAFAEAMIHFHTLNEHHMQDAWIEIKSSYKIDKLAN